MAPPAGRNLRVGFQSDWDPNTAGPGHQGLSYPEVRYILPDRISLELSADPRTLETMARFLERLDWLVRRVAVS